MENNAARGLSGEEVRGWSREGSIERGNLL